MPQIVYRTLDLIHPCEDGFEIIALKDLLAYVEFVSVEKALVHKLFCIPSVHQHQIPKSSPRLQFSQPTVGDDPQELNPNVRVEYVSLYYHVHGFYDIQIVRLHCFANSIDNFDLLLDVLFEKLFLFERLILGEVTVEKAFDGR